MNGGKWFSDRTQFQTNSFVKRNKKNSYLLNSYHFHESKNNIKKVFIAFFATKDEKRFLDNGCFPFLCCGIYVQANRYFKLLRFKPSVSSLLQFYFQLVVLWKNLNLFILHSISWMFVLEIWFSNHQNGEIIFGCYHIKALACSIQFQPLDGIYFHPFSLQHPKVDGNIKLYSAQLANILKTTKNRKFTRFRHTVRWFLIW